MNATEIAVAFVDLALADGLKRSELRAENMQALFNIVSAAGFEPKQVVPGMLTGTYRDQDGSATGETYPINQLCPFKVIGVAQEDGKSLDHYPATYWLERALGFVVENREGKDRQQLIEAIRSEIERSIQLEPIQLTPEGDLLQEYPPVGMGFVDHTRDDRELSSCVGLHKYCTGWVDRNPATATHNALSCRKCNLRVLFPKEVKTYGELRQALASKFVQPAA